MIYISYFVLLIGIIELGIFSYNLFKKDFLSPSLISLACFAFAFICAFVGLFSWNFVSELGPTSFIIFILGFISFFLGELSCRVLFDKKKINEKINIKNNFKINSISRSVLIIVFVSSIITTSLLIYEIIKFCYSYGYYDKSFSNILAFYRSKSELFSSDISNKIAGINFFVKQLQKVCNAINIILFVYFINIIFDKKKTSKFDFFIIVSTIIINLLQTVLFNGGRSIMIHYIVGFFGIVVFYYFFVFNRKINKKIFMYLIPCVAVVISIYFFMLPLLGRKTKHDFIKYNTFEFGTAIPSLELYVVNDNSRSNRFGEDTFTGVYYSLNKAHIINYSEPLSHEWYSYADGGTLSSNTFTSLRSYYKDFGYIGIVFLQFLFGFLITFAYLFLKNNNKNNLLICIYFNYFYVLFDQIRDEQFYSLISISTVVNLLILILIYFLLYNIQKKKEA